MARAIFRIERTQEVLVLDGGDPRDRSGVWTLPKTLRIGDPIGLIHAGSDNPSWATVVETRPTDDAQWLEIELLFEDTLVEPAQAIIRGLNDVPVELARKTLWERLLDDQ